MEFAFIGIGIIIGALITWLFIKLKHNNSTVTKSELYNLQEKYNNISSKLASESDKKEFIEAELLKANANNKSKEEELRTYTGAFAAYKAEIENLRITEGSAKKDLQEALKLLETERQQKSAATTHVAQLDVEKNGLLQELTLLKEKYVKSEEQLEKKTNDFNEANKKAATLEANNKALEENQKKQKEEIDQLGKKFNQEFENIANKILEEKTEKFTNTNKINLESLLKPLGENIDIFKKKVEEVYDKEAKERFSLGEKVKELVGLNEKLSKEAHNLTMALKADPKAQGMWGEMILESILEQSGLTKDQEYFLENYLKDENGNFLLNEDGNKMRPDAIIRYPDDRKVIIDSKVSLMAYTKYLGTDDVEEQKRFIKQHVQDVKNHIVGLSKRGYENFDKSLDFVMMFIPNEPAYMLVVKEEPDIWNFAYEKRIILISPTNLIAALKLISNLWDREHQSKNAQAIVERGEKLYSKFVGFTVNFKKVGDSIGKAQVAYDDATKQLSTGRDNLILQAEKLKSLKIKPKRKFPAEFLDGNRINQELENE